MPDNITDISGRSWSDLADDADRAIIRELAGERDGISGNAATDAIVACLFAQDGRQDEIPDGVCEEYADAIAEAEDAVRDDTHASESAETAAADGGGDGNGGGEADNEDAPVADDREPEEDDASTGRQSEVGYGDGGPPSSNASFIIEARALQDWIGYIGVLVDEAKVHLEYDGLAVTAVDPANVGMVDTALFASAFDSYDAPDPGVIGINVDRLDGVVGSAPVDALVNLEYDAKTRHLIVQWGGHRFNLATIDPDSIRKEPDLPDLDLPAKVRFDRAGDLKDALGFANDVSDHVQLSAYDDGGDSVFEVAAEGDTDSYDKGFTPGEDDMSFHYYGEAKSVFSLDYLTDMEGAWDRETPIDVTVGVEFPTEIDQAVVSDDREVGEATYLLAPRIQSD